MMKTILTLILSVYFLTSLFATDKQKKYPEERITVEKEYDEQGSLIRKDSTYSYIYSNDDINFNKLDSIVNYSKISKKLFDKDFGFFNDSSLLNFSNEFIKSMESNFKFLESQMEKMESFKQKMDSIQQFFFKEFDKNLNKKRKTKGAKETEL